MKQYLQYGMLFLFVLAISNLQGQNCSISLGQDTALCSASFTIQPSLSLTQFEDSLEIIYDATQGQSALAGASKVYMHSAAELVPFGGWQNPIGNWGQDDGLGEMSPLGNDRWRIVILPYQYYGYAQNASINGLFMVFRNADGTATGKDANGNDIWADMGTNPPSSTFGGVQFNRITDALDSILWSDGSTGPSLTVNTPGSYSVQMFDTAGCVASDTIQVGLGTIPSIDLGQPVICNGNAVTLDAGAGFANYAWSTGASSQTISLSSPSVVLVTVTNAQGCEGIDVVNVPAGAAPNANFVVNVFSMVGVNFIDASTGGGDYAWDFDNDGQIDDTTPGNVTHYYPAGGNYTCRLIVSNYCGTDTHNISLTVGETATNNEFAPSFTLFPNPASNTLFLEMENPKGVELVWKMVDSKGRLILARNEGKVSHKFRKEINIETLSQGIYTLVLSVDGQLVSKHFLKN